MNITGNLNFFWKGWKVTEATCILCSNSKDIRCSTSNALVQFGSSGNSHCDLLWYGAGTTCSCIDDKISSDFWSAITVWLCPRDRHICTNDFHNSWTARCAWYSRTFCIIQLHHHNFIYSTSFLFAMWCTVCKCNHSVRLYVTLMMCQNTQMYYQTLFIT